MTTYPVTGTPGPPGDWTPRAYSDPFLIESRRIRARKEITLGSIRASLEEQPGPRAVRACARGWVAELLAVAEEVAKNKERRRD